MVPRARGPAGGGARFGRRVAVGGGRGAVLPARGARQGGRLAVQGLQRAGRRHRAHASRRRRPIRRRPRAEPSGPSVFPFPSLFRPSTDDSKSVFVIFENRI